MPVYDFSCKKCGWKSIYSLSVNEYVQSVGWIKCPNCDSEMIRSFSPININVGKCSRVYYQWNGDPNKCPSDIKDALKNQDMPKGVSGFKNEGAPVLGTGDKFIKK